MIVFWWTVITTPQTVIVYICQEFARRRELRAIERTVRAELRNLGVSVRASAGARVAVDLAKRLDAEPGDRSAAMLSRELRLLMTDLRHVKGGGTDEVERFLARIATTDERNATH